MKTNGCAKQVWSGYRSHNCPRAGTIEENGKRWCGQHAPSKVAAREAKWDRESAARMKAFRKDRLAREIADELLKLDAGSIPFAIRNQVDELRELESR